MERQDESIYKIILKCGDTVKLTKEQIDGLYEQFKIKISNWIREKKAECTEEEYEHKMIKFLEVINCER